jgi:hypothetical protein
MQDISLVRGVNTEFLSGGLEALVLAGYCASTTAVRADEHAVGAIACVLAALRRLPVPNNYWGRHRQELLRGGRSWDAQLLNPPDFDLQVKPLGAFITSGPLRSRVA